MDDTTVFLIENDKISDIKHKIKAQTIQIDISDFLKIKKVKILTYVFFVEVN